MEPPNYSLWFQIQIPKMSERSKKINDWDEMEISKGWCGQMFQMFEYLRVVRTVTSKFRFFTLENGQKFQDRFKGF